MTLRLFSRTHADVGIPTYRLALSLMAGGSLALGSAGAVGAAIDWVPAPLPAPAAVPAIAAAWGDYDGDGRPDLAAAALGAGIQLYRNKADGSFESVGERLPNVGRYYVQGVAWVDIDNDGDLDLFGTAWQTGHVLYRNDGRGGFERDERSRELLGATRGMVSAWMDADGDGWVDVVVANGGGASEDPIGYFLGGPEGVFKAGRGSGSAVVGYGAGAAWGDYDGDGDADVVVPVGWTGPNPFLVNEGGDGLRSVVPSPLRLGGETSGGTSAAWGDYDNDGDLDLFVAGGGLGDALYRNDGKGQFTRIQAVRDQLAPGATNGAVWADFDNDGWLDLMVANRTGAPFVLRNLGDGTFAVVADNAISLRESTSNGLAIGDYNGDGALDVAVARWPSGSLGVYWNRGTNNHWLRVRLVGTASNRMGLGAKVRVTTTTGGVETRQLRQVGGEDGWGTQEALAHFGLGSVTNVDTLEVEWPSGGTTTRRRVAADQTLVIFENDTVDLVLWPRAGVYPVPVEVTLRSDLADAEIRYTLDGTEPQLTSPRYSGPLSVTGDVTVRAGVFVEGERVTRVVSAQYLSDARLRLEPAGGIFTNSVPVAIVSELPGAEIHYTIDGGEPTLASPIYREGLRLTEGVTLRARSFVETVPASGVVVGEFRRQYITVDDGIPGDWRRKYFGDEYAFEARASAAADPDFDGTTNFQEYLIGTDPLDPASGIRAGIRMLAEVRFETKAGVRYRVLRSDAVSGVRVVVAEGIVGTGEPMAWTDPATPPANAFYAIEPVP